MRRLERAKRMHENVMDGKRWEIRVEKDNMLAGKLERAPNGQDWILTRIDPLTGEKGETIHIEAKNSPTARLSELQKKVKARLGNKYVVIRG